MDLLRDTIKNNFQTGDKPTQSDFEQFINSGFDLHKFTYDPAYPYEAGNLIVGKEVDTDGILRYYLYQRTSFSVGTIGQPWQNTSYWTKVMGGMNIFNVPIITPVEPPIGSPFRVYDINKAEIGYAGAATENIPAIVTGTKLYFEERVYNAPGKNAFFWELINLSNQAIVDSKTTRDYEYVFSVSGSYKVRLSAWEYGIVDPIVTEYYPITVTSALVSNWTMNIVATPSSYSSEGEEIVFAVTIQNIGNTTITNIELGNTLGIAQQYLELLNPMQTYTFYLNYVTSFNDIINSSVTLQAYANGLNYLNSQVYIQDTEQVNNTNVYQQISITNYLHTPITAYKLINDENVLLNVTALFSQPILDRIQNISYLKLHWSKTQGAGINSGTIDVPDIASTINNQYNFGYGFNVESFVVATNYSMKLIYKENTPGAVEVASTPIRQFYVQDKIGFLESSPITIMEFDGGYRVTIRFNKIFPSFSGQTNTYVFEERLSGGEYTPVQGTITQANASTHTYIRFMTDLVDGDDPATYEFRVTENLGSAGPGDVDNYQESTAEMEYEWTVDAKPLYGKWIVGTGLGANLKGVLLSEVIPDMIPLNDLANGLELNVINPLAPYMNWYSSLQSMAFGYQWVAFPKADYPTPFTIYGEIAGGGLISDYYYVLEDTNINGNLYTLYVVKGTNGSYGGSSIEDWTMGDALNFISQTFQ